MRKVHEEEEEEELRMNRMTKMEEKRKGLSTNIERDRRKREEKENVSWQTN